MSLVAPVVLDGAHELASAIGNSASLGWRPVESMMQNHNESAQLTNVFDADYFRETRPAWQGLDDQTCRAAWRSDPAAAGLACGVDHLICLRLDLDDYPRAFPWRLYVRLRPEAGANRWAALEHYWRQGFKEGVKLPFGVDARRFLVSLARSYANLDDFLSIEAFERAAVLAPLSHDEQQHLGDSYIRLRLYQRAQHVYLNLLRNGGGGDWTLRNCIKSSTAMADWRTAEDVLVEFKTAFENRDGWNSAADDLCATYYEWGLQRARAYYAEGETLLGDRATAASVEGTLGLVERLGLVAKIARGEQRVVVIATATTRSRTVSAPRRKAPCSRICRSRGGCWPWAIWKTPSAPFRGRPPWSSSMFPPR